MNSRDAAYDEEEQLRRAIEASKGEGAVDNEDTGARRGKRGRSASEECVFWELSSTLLIACQEPRRVQETAHRIKLAFARSNPSSINRG